MVQPLDEAAFLRLCREHRAEQPLLDDIKGKSAAEWWREAQDGVQMKWVLDKSGFLSTVEQENAIRNDPYVKLHNDELDELYALNPSARNGQEKGSDRPTNEHERIVNYKWARANAIRKVIGNPFEA